MHKIDFKKLPICLLLASSLMANTNVVTKTLSESDLRNQLNTEAIINNQDTSAIDNKNKVGKSKETSSFIVNDDRYEDMAIYNYYVSYATANNKIEFSSANDAKKSKVSFLSNNVERHEAKIKAEEEELAKALALANKSIGKGIELGSTVYMSGYCYTKNPIEVEQVQGYSILDCTFEDNELNIDSSKMMAMFVPLTKRNALISKPVYIQKGTKKLPITNGVVLTIDRTSMNVANFINDKKLKKLSSDLLTQTGDVLLNNSMAYMEQKEASAKTQDVISDSSVSGTTTTTTTNTEAPNVSTYLVSAGIQLFSAIIKGVGILMSEDKYPLFKVYSNSGFYVDFMIEINEKNSKTLNYMDKSYDEYNKNISVGEDVPEQVLTLPVVK